MRESEQFLDGKMGTVRETPSQETFTTPVVRPAPYEETGLPGSQRNSEALLLPQLTFLRGRGVCTWTSCPNNLKEGKKRQLDYGHYHRSDHQHKRNRKNTSSYKKSNITWQLSGWCPPVASSWVGPLSGVLVRGLLSLDMTLDVSTEATRHVSNLRWALTWPHWLVSSTCFGDRPLWSHSDPTGARVERSPLRVSSEWHDSQLDTRSSKTHYTRSSL